MRWTISFFISVVMACSAPLLAAPAKPGTNRAGYPVQQISDKLQVEQLADGLWMHRTTQLVGGQPISANGLILQTAEGVVLIDTAWGEFETQDLLRWIEVVLKQPVVSAVATHEHEDRTGGHHTLAARGIPLKVTARTAELAAKHGIRDLTVATALDVGQTYQDHELVWFYPGAGHSRDNIVIWLEKYQLLFGGCFIKAPQFPGLGYTGDADVAAWPASLRRTQQAFPQAKIVIPGHGELSDQRLLDYSLGLFKAASQP